MPHSSAVERLTVNQDVVGSIPTEAAFVYDKGKISVHFVFFLFWSFGF